MKKHESNLHFQPLDTYDPDAFFDNQILTIKGAARLLKFSEKTVYRLVKQGKLPQKKIGSEYRFLLSDLLEVIKKGT